MFFIVDKQNESCQYDSIKTQQQRKTKMTYDLNHEIFQSITNIDLVKKFLEIADGDIDKAYQIYDENFIDEFSSVRDFIDSVEDYLPFDDENNFILNLSEDYYFINHNDNIIVCRKK